MGQPSGGQKEGFWGRKCSFGFGFFLVLRVVFWSVFGGVSLFLMAFDGFFNGCSNCAKGGQNLIGMLIAIGILCSTT